LTPAKTKAVFVRRVFVQATGRSDDEKRNDDDDVMTMTTASKIKGPRTKVKLLERDDEGSDDDGIAVSLRESSTRTWKAPIRKKSAQFNSKSAARRDKASEVGPHHDDAGPQTRTTKKEKSYWKGAVIGMTNLNTSVTMRTVKVAKSGEGDRIDQVFIAPWRTIC
jgi:hypothetical protein